MRVLIVLRRYPGCACDIPVHNYAFSWAPFPFFPSFYAPREYIFEYLEEVADQYNLRKYVQTCHKVVGAKWIEERKKWQVQIVRTDGREHVVSSPGVQDGELDEAFVEECDVLINSSGAYNNWRWPTIPNRQSFKGTMIHPAQWPQDFDPTDKTIALIGNGSTGIQILPSILDRASKVYVLLRSRTWITPALAQRFAGPPGTNKIFTEDEQKDWSEHPEKYLAYRKEIESELNARFRLYVKDSQAQKMGKKMTTDQMTSRLSKKPELVDELLPDFAVGCRRPTPGSGYLEALCSLKVEIVWGDIETFNESGVLSASGKQIDVNTIICATGYNMGFVPRFPIIGSHGRDLRQDWTEELPASYLSVTVANMPNYFVYMGPTSPLGHGSIVGSVEHVTGYIRKILWKLQTENYASFSPKPIVTKAWQAHALKWMEKTVWVEGCPSSFKNGAKSGPVISLHPGSRLHYFDLLENPRYEDFEWTSLCDDPMDMFAWLADGFTTWETHATRDLS